MMGMGGGMGGSGGAGGAGLEKRICEDIKELASSLLPQNQN